MNPKLTWIPRRRQPTERFGSLQTLGGIAGGSSVSSFFSSSPSSISRSPENTVLHPLHQVQFATHAKLKVDDFYHNGAARRRLRLHEKGGKEHEMPVHHLLERILDEYIMAAGLRSAQPLFQGLNSAGTA